jgi:hypothetical protein
MRTIRRVLIAITTSGAIIWLTAAAAAAGAHMHT